MLVDELKTVRLLNVLVSHSETCAHMRASLSEQ